MNTMKLLAQNKINNLFKGFLMFMMTYTVLHADVPKNKKNIRMNNGTVSAMQDTTFKIGYNRIVTGMTNTGLLIDYRTNALQNGYGMGIRKSNKEEAGAGSIFGSALWVTADKPNSDNEFIGVVADYDPDMRSGSWGSDLTDPDNKYRMYSVDIDMLSQPELYSDFQNWPTDQGAPWVDVDGDGIYSPLPNGVDHPKFYGDLVVWYVSADDYKDSKINMGTDPTNLEFQTTMYSFYRPDTAPIYDRTVFYRILMINKGTEVLENIYTGLFVDSEIGVAGDDLVGVDVEKNMGYGWNEGYDSQITEYYPNQGMAVGVDLLQGPMVDCTANNFIDITLIGTDADGDALAYNVGTSPSNGSFAFQAQNIIRYTPNENYTGTDSFTYTATDGSLQSNEATVFISVTNADESDLPIISSPNGGESWIRGNTYSITWSNGFNNTGLDLYKGNTKIQSVAGDVGSATSYDWTIPSDLSLGADYRIRVYDAGAGEDEDYSDNYFSITDSSGRTDYRKILTSDLNDISQQYQNELVAIMQNFDHSHYEDENGIIRCGIDQFEQELQLLYPDLIAQRQKFINQVDRNKELIDFSKTSTIKIPVIFHVLYNQASDNISKTFIGENFDQLNLDFQTLNPDTTKVPKGQNPTDATVDPGINYDHYDAIGSHDVQFIGFNGESSGSSLQENTSIRRYNMSQESVSSVSEARQVVDSTTADNGADGGYKEGYFNIYISPLSGSLLGMASFDIPHSVVLTSTVGSVNTPNTSTSSAFNLGRTLTHEVGHNFGYYHTFQHNSCSDTPNMSDIPVQISPNQGGATLYQMPNNSVAWYGGGANNDCISTTGKGEQFMNYMDYSNDADLVMFSKEQAKQGYAWAYTYDWAINQAPSVSNIAVTANINETCGLGAQMFGQYHPSKRNLPLSSFNFTINGDATYTDPSNIDEARNNMIGLRIDGSAYPSYTAGELHNQKFNFYGDPNEAHSTANPVDGNYATAADRRFIMSVGPFNMAAGDSQEVVYAFVHSFADNSLAAVDSLKSDDSQMQSDYNNQFNIFKYTGATNISLAPSITSGFAPLNVTFDASSSSPADYYYWDFNDDETVDSKSSNPTYSFSEPGEYNVKLDVKYKDFINGYSTLSVLSDSVSINVLSPNPTVDNVSFAVNEDTSGVFTLTGSDPQNRSLTFKISQGPLNGSYSLSGSDLTYTPNQNFVGQDTLKYVANNGDYDSSMGIISIEIVAVDDDPTTISVNASTDEDTPVTINLSADEYDGDAYSFTIKQEPSNGTLGDISGSSVIYTPSSDWFGVDKFTYEATDDRFSRINIASATITVNPINDKPISNNMNIASYEDQVTTITLDVNDIDGDNLSVINTDPSNGVISAIDGKILTYKPNENYNGSDSFDYYVNDGEFDSDISTVSINLTPVNDASSDFTVIENYVLNSMEGEQETITTNYLIVSPENEQDSISFVWNESIDIDGDQILYRMIGFDGLEFLTMDDWTADLTLSWSLSDLIAQTDTVNVASGSWLIQATDGEFFKDSNFGEPTLFSINGSALIPEEFILSQNYPNPFSSSTIIQYDLPESQKVVIKIYDVRGRLVKVIVDEEQNAGFKNANWDGTNEDGDQVSSGVYFYQITTKKINKARKMLLIR